MKTRNTKLTYFESLGEDTAIELVQKIAKHLLDRYDQEAIGAKKPKAKKGKNKPDLFKGNSK